MCIGKLNLFSCDPPQTTITWILLCLQWSSVKCSIWIIMDSKSRCLWPFSEHCFHATYFNIPVAEVSCVCSDKAWCALAIVNVDSIILPHGKSPPVCEMGTIKFSLESLSSVSTPIAQSWRLTNLWSYVFCKGVHMTTVVDYLDNAGFNTTAKN